MGVRQRAEFSHVHIYIQGFLLLPFSPISVWKFVGCIFLLFWRGTTLLKRAEQGLRAEGAYGPASEQKRRVKFRLAMAQDLSVLLQLDDSEQMRPCICDPSLVPPFPPSLTCCMRGEEGTPLLAHWAECWRTPGKTSMSFSPSKWGQNENQQVSWISAVKQVIEANLWQLGSLPQEL